MDEKLFDLTYKLKLDISNDSRIKKLNELEEKMNNDDEVISLAYKKDVLSSEYSSLLSYLKDDDPLVVCKRKELYEVKKKLDSLDLVKQYNKAYQEVRLLLEEIDNILFKDIKENKYESCRR